MKLHLTITKKKLNADEIIVAIMESKTGKILTMASSNRFNPESIRQEDIPNLNVNAVEYQFEPGSVVKPLSISLAMDKGLIKRMKVFQHIIVVEEKVHILLEGLQLKTTINSQKATYLLMTL